MTEEPRPRFEIVVEQGPPHGDLFELEQTTYYHVVDSHNQQIVMTFQSEMEASLSRDTGLWDDYRFSGVCDVAMAPNGLSVIVKYCDEREEVVELATVLREGRYPPWKEGG